MTLGDWAGLVAVSLLVGLGVRQFRRNPVPVTLRGQILNMLKDFGPLTTSQLSVELLEPALDVISEIQKLVDQGLVVKRPGPEPKHEMEIVWELRTTSHS